MKIYQTDLVNRNFAIQTLLSRKLWKSTLVLSTIIVTTISLIAPVIAQIIRPSQDFFDQGREQLEREIQILREPNTPENPQKKPEPILQVSPTPANERRPNLPSETPSPTPNQINNSR